MLRYDIPPVCSYAYRMQALVACAVAAVYLFTPHDWAAMWVVISGLVRGFVSPHKSLSYKLFSQITHKARITSLVNAGARMFADKVIGMLGLMMVASWLAGSEIGCVPAAALLVLSLVDAVTGFCVVCWAYGLWYRMRPA